MTKKLNPELTAEMHCELMAGEISHKEMMIMKAYCAIEKGEPKLSVLSRCGLSEQEYDSNIERVLHS